MCALLAVDVGLRTGYALFDRKGRVCWYRSRKLGSTQSLKGIVHGLLEEHPEVRWIVLEGGGSLGEIWAREARRRKISVLRVSAETWRKAFLYPRQQRSGSSAKQNAGALARRVIEWSGAPRPTSLRHDAAESIMIGLFGVLEIGWLKSLPAQVTGNKTGSKP